MSVHLTGDRDKIKCFHRYTIDYECGFIILLYRLSRPRRVRHDMEKSLGSGGLGCRRLYGHFRMPYIKLLIHI